MQICTCATQAERFAHYDGYVAIMKLIPFDSFPPLDRVRKEFFLVTANDDIVADTTLNTRIITQKMVAFKSGIPHNQVSAGHCAKASKREITIPVQNAKAVLTNKESCSLARKVGLL